MQRRKGASRVRWNVRLSNFSVSWETIEDFDMKFTGCHQYEWRFARRSTWSSWDLPVQIRNQFEETPQELLGGLRPHTNAVTLDSKINH